MNIDQENSTLESHSRHPATRMPPMLVPGFGLAMCIGLLFIGYWIGIHRHAQWAEATRGCQPLEILHQHMPDVAWETASEVRTDLNGDGKLDFAYMGRRDNLFFVSVVLGPVSVKSLPSSVQLFNHTTDDTQDSVREPNPRLIIETLDYDPTDAIGGIPEGLQRSRVASGLYLSSGDTDPFHFFWNHLSNALDWWRL